MAGRHASALGRMNDEGGFAKQLREATIEDLPVQDKKHLERQNDTQKKRIQLLRQRLDKDVVMLKLDVPKWIMVTQALSSSWACGSSC